ncbi:MAG: hypothetical protein FHP94_19335 [Denitromonas halophila]|nr:MAG: hypothetical protein FHP94_19335 [Denitromonas halophila]TVT70521.1 MAG: hypothetical protein FHP93_11810 [Denitromonas halophila]
MLDTALEIASRFGEVIAVSVTAFSSWVAYKQIKKQPEQKESPDSARIERPTEPKEPEHHTKQLVVFSTENQKTTLIATTRALECHLFDSRPSKHSGVQWRISSEDAKKIAKTEDYDVHTGYKPKSGTFRIGNKANWLYSKSIFPEPDDLRQKLVVLLNSFAE